jgi:divalent anion:Na+ symporter, DASS family
MPGLTTSASSDVETASVRPQPPPPSRRWTLLLVLGAGILIWVLPHPAAIDPQAWRLFAIFVATIIGIIARPLPMGAIAMVGISSALLTRTLTIAEALSGFANPTLWLVAAAFFLANGFIKTGLGTRLSYALVALFGRSTLGVGYSLVLTDLLLAPAIASSTARAGGIIFPILQSLSKLARETDPVRGRLTSAFLTLTVYQGTVVTSAMFLTATVVNPLAAQLAAAQGISISWTTWAVAGSVPGLLSLAIVPAIVYRMCPPGTLRTPEAPAQAASALVALGPMTRREWAMASISTLLIAAWIFGSVLELDATAAAIVAISALLITGVLNWEDITGEREAWNMLVWFGSLVMMATYLGQRGLLRWFTTEVGGAFTDVNWAWGFLGLGLVYFYSHYLFVSNTAHVSAMFAPFLAVAVGLGTPPLLAALMLCAFSSLDACLTHYGTPSGPILFASNNVPIGAWWKTGAVLSVVHIIIWFSVGAAWWQFLGLW